MNRRIEDQTIISKSRLRETIQSRVRVIVSRVIVNPGEHNVPLEARGGKRYQT